MLAQCPALAHLDLSGNYDFGAAGAKACRSAGTVLGQYRELVHLNLHYNMIGDAEAQRLTESWSGPEGGLLLKSQVSEEESVDEEESYLEDEEAHALLNADMLY